MGDIQRVAYLVETECLTVVGKLPFNLQPGRTQQVPQRVFVFVAVQPSLSRTALAGGFESLLGGQGGREGREESFGFQHIGALPNGFRRHFAGSQAVMDLDPFFDSRGIELRGA